MYAEEKLKAEIIQKAMEKSGKAIPAKGDGATCSKRTAVSIRLACEAFSISETCYRYHAKLFNGNALEIDVQYGGSVQYWARYLKHPEVRIVGVDL